MAVWSINKSYKKRKPAMIEKQSVNISALQRSKGLNEREKTHNRRDPGIIFNKNLELVPVDQKKQIFSFQHVEEFKK